MGKKDRGSFHRKRAQKIAKQKSKKSREQRIARQRVPLEYTGNRYHAPRYTHSLMMAEMGIRDAHHASGHKLHDSDVRGALGVMVKHLRLGSQDVMESLVELRESPGDNDAQRQIVTGIVNRWLIIFDQLPRLPRADLVGILRTLVHSLDVRGEMHPGGRGYLNFLDEFLPEDSEIWKGSSAADIIEWYRTGGAVVGEHWDDIEDGDNDGDDDEIEMRADLDDPIGHLYDDQMAIDVQHRPPPTD